MRLRATSSGLGYVVPAPTKPDDGDMPGYYQNCRKVLQSLLDEAGFPWAPHTLRTTVATSLLDRGVPLRKVADLLGHSTPTVTLTSYAGRSKPGDMEVATALGDL